MKNKLLLLSTIFILLIINCQAQDQFLIDSLELQLKNHTAKKTELGLKSLSLYATKAINILYPMHTLPIIQKSQLNMPIKYLVYRSSSHMKKELEMHN
jgi:hypothetical protein